VKDWRTLAAEGPIGRYLLTLDRRRRESMNRDLVRLLQEGGRGMSLRSDVKEAMVLTLSDAGLPQSGRAIQEEKDDGWAGWKMARAALSVCDGYGEMEMQEMSGNPDYLRGRGTVSWEPQRPSFTVYRKKQEPELGLKELARRAVKAWRGSHGSLKPVTDAMDALEAKLNE